MAIVATLINEESGPYRKTYNVTGAIGDNLGAAPIAHTLGVKPTDVTILARNANPDFVHVVNYTDAEFQLNQAAGTLAGNLDIYVRLERRHSILG